VIHSIRWRLAASYAILILLSVTLMGALALYIVQRSIAQQEGEFLSENARAVAVQAERFIAPQFRRIALQELAATSAFLGDARVRILDPEKNVIADSGDPGMPDEYLWLIPSGLAEIDPERRAAAPLIIPMPHRHDGGGSSPRALMPMLRDLPLGTTWLYARRMLTPWGRRFVFEGDGVPMAPPEDQAAPARQFLSVTLPLGDARSPMGFVEMSSPLSLSDKALRPMRTAVLLSGLGALAIAVAAGLLFGRTITRPLASLADTARRMAEGDLTARASSTRRDEIGQLARQWNAMAENLETSFRDLRTERDSLSRFVADASHELRTPITALATFNELLQGSAADDAAARQEFLRESQGQLSRLQWITSNLLDLSRLDAGIASLSVQRHAAADLVESAVAGLRGRAREKSIQLSVEPCDPAISVPCDRNRVEMALANLVANAVKFTPERGMVSAWADAERARFEVSDTGPGISAEELPLIFERFYRGRNATPEGAGLGLAIAQSVARAHGGDIAAENREGGGSAFTLSLPLA
jgi:signal transduction histidine kinase